MLAGGDAGRVGLGGAADEHVELGGERGVIRAATTGCSQSGPRNSAAGSTDAGERTPLRLDRAKRGQVAHHGDIDRHSRRDVITPPSARVAIATPALRCVGPPCARSIRGAACDACASALSTRA